MSDSLHQILKRRMEKRQRVKKKIGETKQQQIAAIHYTGPTQKGCNKDSRRLETPGPAEHELAAILFAHPIVRGVDYGASAAAAPIWHAAPDGLFAESESDPKRRYTPENP